MVPEEDQLKQGAQLIQWAIWLISNWHVLMATLGAVAVLQVVLFFRKKASKPFLNPEEFQVCASRADHVTTNNIPSA